jgi:hypothetical protein
MLKMLTRLSYLFGFSLLLSSLPVQAQEALARWNGIWTAEGTSLTLRVTSRDQQLHIEPVADMGFIWRNSTARVNGDSATLQIEYEGVIATVLVQLGAANTAMARPLGCQPDYHIVCALVQNQQARFVKIAETTAQAREAETTTNFAQQDSTTMGG